jgi:hypothetical protein
MTVSEKTTTTTPSLQSSEKQTQLVYIPSLPSVRFVSSLTPCTSSSSTHLSEKPVQEVIFRHGRVEDAPFMTEMQFSNYKYHYSHIMAKDVLDNLNHEDMTRFHANNMTRKWINYPIAAVAAFQCKTR